jgi:hypothetical protein
MLLKRFLKRCLKKDNFKKSLKKMLLKRFLKVAQIGKNRQKSTINSHFLLYLQKTVSNVFHDLKNVKIAEKQEQQEQPQQSTISQLKRSLKRFN